MSMDVEVAVAWNFVISHLYNKLPRRRVLCFGEALDRGFKRKFQGHWYPDMPFKGSAFRCVKVSGVAADPVIEQAARECGVSIDEVREFLPDELTVWIDPKEVSYRIGEKGVVKILYSARKEEFSCEVVDTEMRSINDSLSASLSSLSLSPADAPPTCPPWQSTSPTHLPMPQYQPLVRNHQEQIFTAAMFAQTKFGSTKLRSSAKRPNRLSPVELCGYAPPPPVLPQRAILQSHWINGVGAVSPAGMASYNAVNGFPGPVYPGTQLHHPAIQQQQPSHHDVIAPPPHHPGTAGSSDMQHDVMQQQRLMLYQQQQQQQHRQEQQRQQQILHHNNAFEHPHAVTSPLSDLNAFEHTHAVTSPLSDLNNPPTVQAPVNPAPTFPANSHDVTQPPATATADDDLESSTAHSMAGDLGLAGIMSRLSELEAANDSVWGSSNSSSAPSPYANLQHLLVAN